MDMAPTVLDLFGVPIPAYMQGRPLFAAAPRAAAQKPSVQPEKVAT